MAKYDALIIGSGLGGLVCAYILSKEGFKVCVIEKHYQLGGCMQTFKRDGCIFDTGVHYVGGLNKGSILHKYFKYFNLIDDINVRKLDTNFDIVNIYDRDYYFATGFDNFVETLSVDFPKERDNIAKYIEDIKKLSKQFPLYNLEEVTPGSNEKQLFELKVYDKLRSITNNEKLQNVLAGTNMLYAGIPSKTPFYLHALINYANIDGSWRFVDGSSQIVDSLVASIKSNGGEIMTRAEAIKFEFDDKIVSCVELSDGRKIEAKNVISSIHPVHTLSMIEKGKIREAFRMRINALENSISTFIMYVVLKENSFNYMNYNVYFHNQNSVWAAANYDSRRWPEAYLMLTPASSKSTEYADCMTIMTVMSYEEVRKWENTSIEKRGEEYKEFKKQKAEKLLDLVEKRIPGFRNHIKTYYTSSPLTYRDYTGTKNGAAYGIIKDADNLMKTQILPKTKIPNLYLTGQNTNLHGVLGVTVGAVITCCELLEMNYLIRKIRAAN